MSDDLKKLCDEIGSQGAKAIRDGLPELGWQKNDEAWIKHTLFSLVHDIIALPDKRAMISVPILAGANALDGPPIGEATLHEHAKIDWEGMVLTPCFRREVDKLTLLALFPIRAEDHPAART